MIWLATIGDWRIRQPVQQNIVEDPAHFLQSGKHERFLISGQFQLRHGIHQRSGYETHSSFELNRGKFEVSRTSLGIMQFPDPVQMLDRGNIERTAHKPDQESESRGFALFHDRVIGRDLFEPVRNRTVVTCLGTREMPERRILLGEEIVHSIDQALQLKRQTVTDIMNRFDFFGGQFQEFPQPGNAIDRIVREFVLEFAH